MENKKQNIYTNAIYLIGGIVLLFINMRFMINIFSIFNMLVFILQIIFIVIQIFCLAMNIKYYRKILKESSRLYNSQDQVDKLQDKK